MPRLRLRLGRLVFAPTLVPTLLLVPLLALLVMLGRWQLERAAHARALATAFTVGEAAPVVFDARAAQPRYRRVTVTGHYLADQQFLLDNMTHDGTAGYHALTPLVTDSGTTVLVDRGWLAVGGDRRRLPELAVGVDRRELSGRLDELPVAGISLAAPEGSGWPRVVSFPKHAELERALGRRVWPQLLLLDAALPDGFVRSWRPAGLAPERHLGYAVQWFALALALLLAYLIANLERQGANR